MAQAREFSQVRAQPRGDRSQGCASGVKIQSHAARRHDRLWPAHPLLLQEVVQEITLRQLPLLQVIRGTCSTARQEHSVTNLQKD